MAGAQQSAGDVQRCIDRARSERHGPNTLGCKHAQNLEYALFFQYMMESSVERNPQGMEAQWSKTLFKIVGSLRKLPSRVRSLEHANAIHGVGPRTLDLFRRYLTAHPPDPPSDAELLADEAAAEATRAAKEAEKARKKAERDAKKRAADDACARSQAKSSAPTPRTPVDDPGGAARRRYDPRGADDDIIAIVLDDSPATRPSEPSKRNRRNPTKESAADDADAARPPKRARAPATKQTRKDKPSRWEPGYRTAPFALLATLHRLYLQGDTTVGKKRLMDAAELSGLSAQGIYPKGDDAQGVGVGGYRGDGARFAYSGWSCFGKQLAKAPKGWPAPMVMTWSNPVQIRLTDEGKMLGAWMHAAAETRGDCACGLMSAEDVARAEAERRRIVFGAAEPGRERRGRRRARPRTRARPRARALEPRAAARGGRRGNRKGFGGGEREAQRDGRRVAPARARARGDARGNRQDQGVRSRRGAERGFLGRGRGCADASARARGRGGGETKVRGRSRAGAGAGAERRRRRRPG
jgi:crossover junction endonuclease MUS81